MTHPTRDVSLLLFPRVEVLDFAGPFEVFSVADPGREPRPFRVRTVAREAGPLEARGGLTITPQVEIGEVTRTDVLVVPGGPGVREALGDAETVSWVREMAGTAEITLSVCTGALLLARTGLLAGRRVTTHHENLDELGAAAPEAEVVADVPWVDAGSVVTAGGVSSGIAAALHVVERLLGAGPAARTARYIEYPWPGGV
jgi:transcriptional regulator GlxA family with amidase domain